MVSLLVLIPTGTIVVALVVLVTALRRATALAAVVGALGHLVASAR